MTRANRLASERSPYLLQHAHNPVDWYPWGDEAFERARRENKPVFLSVGYSACHWCHVMERESFEDDATARYLNEHFVSIKVDREERPDVDQIYQLAYQVLSQRAGGWPLSMFLTADKQPFFGGTYFPNGRRHGMPSFRDVLAALVDAFEQRRGDVDAQAAELTRVLASATAPAASKGASMPIDREALADATAALLSRRDRVFGGFGRAPKFPSTMNVDVLLVSAAVRDDATARDHALLTLDRMARGGMFDHLGGGFARYSTDERWLIPHFEKMLYDNAQLTRLYLDGWRTVATAGSPPIDRARCETVIRRSIAYLLREMADEATGVFYSAQDADSEGVEGKFFVWTPAEVQAVVGADAARVVCAYFDVSENGNFEHGKSALWTPRSDQDVAASLDMDVAGLRAVIERARGVLFSARELRQKPLRDEKCLASWNALAIGALADAGATLGEPSWVEAASRALRSWRERAWREGRLAHAMKAGEAYGSGYLDDYAGLAGAALDVFEPSGEPMALAFARELLDATIERFWDDGQSTFFYTPFDGEIVLHRTHEVHDHAYPGGVGLVSDALLRAADLTGELRYRTIAERLLASVAGAARENPLALGTVVRAVDRLARGSVAVVIVGDRTRADTQALERTARATYLPHRMIVVVENEAQAAAQGLDTSWVTGRSADADGSARAFVCRGTVCSAPVRDAATLATELQAALRA